MSSENSDYLDIQQSMYKTVVTIIKEGKSTDYHYLTYHDEKGEKKRVLHREDGAAIESKTEKKYFIKGEEIFNKKI